MKPELHRERRTALLDRLVALFVDEGFADLTMDDMARRLQCSKSTLYQLAGSRQELVVAGVRRYFEAAVPVVEARIAGADDPGARVAAYLSAVADHLRPLSRAFVADLAAFAPADRIYRANTAAAADRIRELISEGIAAGDFRDVHAGFVAEMVAATMFEIQRGEMFARLELTDAEAYAELAAFVVAALDSLR